MPTLADLALGADVSGAIDRGLQTRRTSLALRDEGQQRQRQQNIDRLFSRGIPDDPAQRQLIEQKSFALGGADAGLQVRSLFQQMSAQEQEQTAREGRMVATALAGVQDQSSYEGAVAALQGQGLDTSSLPAQFDPDAIGTIVNLQRDIEDILKPAETKALSPGQSLVNTETGRTVASLPAAATGGPNPQDQFKNANTLRDEFVSQTNNFAEAQRGLQKVRDAANDNTGPGDVALIFGFMKTIDPESTVREGEFATAEQTGSIPERIVGLYNNAIRGDRLTVDQRQRFAATAESQFESQRGLYDQTVNEYTRLAESFGLPPAQVVIDRTLSAPPAVDETTSTSDIQPPLASMPRPTTQEGYDALPAGAWYIDPDSGQPARKGR